MFFSRQVRRVEADDVNGDAQAGHQPPPPGVGTADDGVLAPDKVFRKTLAKHVNAIVTFSDYHRIFGQRTIQISNGVDFDSIPLKKMLSKNTSVIHLLGVAEVHYWHGYDRLIDGLGKYYQNPANTTVFFHIAGGIWKSEMQVNLHQ